MNDLHAGDTYAEWIELNRVEAWPLPPYGQHWYPEDWRLAAIGMRAQRDSLVAEGCPEEAARRVTELAWFKGADAALLELSEALS